MPTDDFQLGSAVIPVRVDDSQVGPGLSKVESAVRQAGGRAESAGGGEGGGLMGKYMFGRRGPDGVGESVEHALGHAAFGRAFKMFAAGGIMGVGIGLLAHGAMELGESLISAAFGWDKMGQAAERAKKAAEEWTAAERKVIELNLETAKMKGAPGVVTHMTGSERLESILHPPTPLDSGKEKIKENEARIMEERKLADAAREHAANAVVTPEEIAKLRKTAAAKAGIPESSGIYAASDKLGGEVGAGRFTEEQERDIARRIEGKRRGREDTLKAMAAAHEGTATQLEAENTNTAIMHGAPHVAGDMFGRLFSGGRVSTPGMSGDWSAAGGGKWAMPGLNTEIPSLGGAMAGAGRLLGSGVGSLFGSIGRGGGVFDEQAKGGEHISEMRKRFADRKADYEDEKKFKGPMAAADVGNIGQQIQQALLEPSPWEREGRQLDRDIAKYSREIAEKITNLDPKAKVNTDIKNAAVFAGAVAAAGAHK